jgi:hypothetical protein
MSMVMRYTHLLDEHKKKGIQLLDSLVSMTKLVRLSL